MFLTRCARACRACACARARARECCGRQGRQQGRESTIDSVHRISQNAATHEILIARTADATFGLVHGATIRAIRHTAVAFDAVLQAGIQE